MGCCKTTPVTIPIPTDTPTRNSPRQRTAPRSKFLATKLNSITERFEVLRALGSGTIGTLFHAKELKTGEIRTIREVNKSSFFYGFEVFQEVNILRDLDHPNILKIFDAVETSRSYYIVLESISGGTLHDRFGKGKIEGVISRYVYQMFSGLDYLHKQGVVHCNLASEYVVLSDESEESIVKIIGFTSAQKVESKREIDMRNLKINFASPEAIKGDFSQKSDVWSAGVILYHLLVDKQPFPKGSRNILIEAIMSGNIDYNNLTFQGLSIEAQNLVKLMLQIDPEDRPTCEEVLSHPWFYESKQTLPITYNISEKLRKFSIKTATAKHMLIMITEKLSSIKKDFNVLNYFKSLDLNQDEKVSREEIINVFTQVGLNVSNDIDFIMENLDANGSGFVNYPELILALTNWNQELKKKNIQKVFKSENGYVSIEFFKSIMPGISNEEWSEFTRQVSAERGKVSVANLKRYLKFQTNSF